MYTTTNIVLVDRDEIIAGVGAGHAAPIVQLYNSDLIGAPVTLQFGNASNTEEGLRVLDRFFAELHKVRVELLRRRGITFTPLDAIDEANQEALSALEQRAMDGDR